MRGAGGIRLRLRAKAVRGSDAPLGRHSLPLCSNPPFHFANAKAPHEGVLLRWRSGWDSNPRDVAVKLISSQPRYDHFDTAPWQRRNYITRHQTLARKLKRHLVIRCLLSLRVGFEVPFAQWSPGVLGADSVLPFAPTNSPRFRLRRTAHCADTRFVCHGRCRQTDFESAPL